MTNLFQNSCLYANPAKCQNIFWYRTTILIKLRKFGSKYAEYTVNSAEMSKIICRNLNLDSKILKNCPYTEKSLKLKYILQTRLPGYTTISRSAPSGQNATLAPDVKVIGYIEFKAAAYHHVDMLQFFVLLWPRLKPR